MHYTRSDGKAWAREKLVGQWTTMITPFTSEDELDEKGLAANIEHVLRLGTRGLGFSWNMGEFWSLTREERYRLMELAPQLVRGRALVAFQVTDTSLKDVVAMAHRAEDLGFDFVILASPYMATKTEEQVLDWVTRVAEQVNIGIAFYNSPQFGIVLSAKALSRMADLPTLIAIKEASFNIQLSIDTHLEAGAKAVVSMPDEEIFFVGEPYGIHQQVMFANTSDWRFDTLTSSNYVRFIDLATGGRWDEALRLYPKIRPIKAVSRKWWARLRRSSYRGGFADPDGEALGRADGNGRGPGSTPASSLDADGAGRDAARPGGIGTDEAGRLDFPASPA